VNKLFNGKAKTQKLDILKILDKFENPHQGIKIVHVAGTNGKGSVTIKSAECLRRAGRVVG